MSAQRYLPNGGTVSNWRLLSRIDKDHFDAVCSKCGLKRIIVPRKIVSGRVKYYHDCSPEEKPDFSVFQTVNVTAKPDPFLLIEQTIQKAEFYKRVIDKVDMITVDGFSEGLHDIVRKEIQDMLKSKLLKILNIKA